ncbi:MAG: hypothetical protein ACREJB_00890 [Planctomycetaceae bacterium]
MSLRVCCAVWIGLIAGSLMASDGEYKLESVEKVPEGVSKDIAAALNPKGHRVAGPDGTIVDVWLLKTIEAKADFNPTLAVKYPLESGQLVGVMRVEGGEYTDFRGQEVTPGVYTLRYGLQPQDGNHIGTSLLRDFLLGLPAKIDTALAPIASDVKLSEQSAEAVGTAHPAIFSLQSREDGGKPGTLEHNEDTGFWILNLPVRATPEKALDRLRLVVIGISEG